MYNYFNVLLRNSKSTPAAYMSQRHSANQTQSAALSRRVVLTAWLVGSYIGRAKLPSSRLVRRTWLLPNTPRRVRQPPPGRPRQAANSPPQKQVGATT